MKENWKELGFKDMAQYTTAMVNGMNHLNHKLLYYPRIKIN